MDQSLLDQLKKTVTGDVLSDKDTLYTYSHDTSLFEIKPQAVVFPKTEKDVQNLVKFVGNNKKKYKNLSLTGRSAGTDMSGGSINDGIIVEFTKYFNKMSEVKGNVVTTQPGVYYRDFEKETLKKNLLFASYPASKNLCAMGGIVNNNSGGEKSLLYGKTEKYVKRIKAVLADGSIAELKPLNERELKEKMSLKTFEGKLYREMYELVSKNYDFLEKSKPEVTKNSAGYYLWNVWDEKKKIFDLTQVWVGAQGTFGLMLDADIELVPVSTHHEMVVLFLKDYKDLNEIIDTVLPLQPESFESYDDNTLKLALKFFPEFAKSLGTKGLIQTGFSFLPEFFMLVTGGLPKLILQIEFAGDNLSELDTKAQTLLGKLKHFKLKSRVEKDKGTLKYWAIRRESFALLRQKIQNMHTAPFIDDFVIDPHDTGEVIPQVASIVSRYKGFIFTIAGHVGNGNFHIIPLTEIQKKEVRDAIPVISNKVYEIISKHHGSITGEHNDGLIRTPYLKEMYGEKMVELFKKTKEIFDPLDIFNPRKKVGGTLDYAMKHVRIEW